jgi:cytochrome b
MFTASGIHRSALAMMLMMTVMFALGVTDFMQEEIDMFWGEEWLEQVHEFIADGLMGLVGLHLLAAALESCKLRDNLALSMITGRRKPLPARDQAT